jgi:S1-C subfamily serine protease
MSPSDIYDAVKKATVAIVATYPGSFPQRPFTIFGSGFCIHPEGVIVTCEHVFKAFFYPKQSTGSSGGPFKMMAPHAVFYGGVQGKEIHMHPVGIYNAVMVNGFDLGALKVHRHPAFPQGYPTLPIADYSELHEMLEVATCGFPLGEVLQDQLGTVTSSFTKGMISSIIPAQGVAREHLRGFQLDLTATNGNSGGPVFSLVTGRVFGVLQRGVVHPQSGHIVQGLTKAEPVYPLFADDLINRLLSMPMPRAGGPL